MWVSRQGWSRGVLALGLLLCLLSPARAEGIHFGAGFALAELRIDGETADRPAVVQRLSLGFDVLDLGLATLSVELERGRSVRTGRWEGETTEYNSEAGFVALRTGGPLYLIARVGQQKSRFSPDPRRSTTDRESVVGAGLGFGAGIHSEIMVHRVDHGDGAKSQLISWSLYF